MQYSISSKIFSISFLILVLLTVVTAISSLHLDAVMEESLELSNYYLPIERKIDAAANGISQEIIHFERATNLRLSRETDEKIRAEYRLMQEEGAKVDKVISEALGLVKKGLADSSVHVDLATFTILKRELPEIVASHKQFEKTMGDYLSGASPVKDSASRLLFQELLSSRRENVAKEIQDVTEIIGALSEDSSRQAVSLEHEAQILTWSVTALAILLGLVTAALLTKILVRPVRDLMTGTKAVHDGDLNVLIDVKTSDEMKSLADSFNTMISGLRQKEEIQSTFGKYVDPRIVEKLIEDHHFAQTGVRRPMTVFFSDLEGFTSLCEQITPDAMVKLLNRYFNTMSASILASQGLIDKYIGDSIMAFWGPPFTSETNHAELACESAIAQGIAIAEFRTLVPDIVGLRKGVPRVNMRIGIATGDVTVGNVGSDQLKGYTVIGDTVNLAARLESANKQYGTHTLIAESTWELLGEDFMTREIDQIRVMGKSEPVRVFELLGKTGEVDPVLLDLRQSFQSALAAYRLGDLPKAVSLWEECAKIAPDDKATRIFLERCATLAEDGLPEEWDGIWTLSKK